MSEPTLKPWWDAVAAALADEGIPAHLVEVVEATPTLPYVLIWGSLGVPARPTLGGALSTVAEDVNLTVVSSTVSMLQAAVSRVRSVLSRGLEVEGWLTFWRLTGSEPMRTDGDVTLPETGRHPVFVVDTWSVRATPKGETSE